MTKQITYLPSSDKWESTNDWDSHRPLLWLVVNKLKPDLTFECGSGMGSTPFLDSVCKKFVTLENKDEWASKYYNTLNGLMMKTDNWESVKPIEADLLFVDCAPGEARKLLIEKAANLSKVIVAHDTEPGANYVYGMAEVLSTFKYRIDYCPEGKPWTTAVSNFVNIEEWI